MAHLRDGRRRRQSFVRGRPYSESECVCVMRNQGVGPITRGSDTMSGSDDSTGREFLGVHESRSISPDDQMSVDSQNPDVVLDGGQKTYEGSTSSLDELYDDENKFCFENLTSFERGGVSDDDTWNEWDAAALLESKRRKVQESGKNMSISKKRKDRPNRGMSAAKALRTGLWSAAIGNKKVIRKKEKIAATVAGFAMQAMDFIIWGDLKERLSPDDYETLWRSVFTSVVKFVLSIFDVVKSSSMSGLARSFAPLDNKSANSSEFNMLVEWGIITRITYTALFIIAPCDIPQLPFNTSSTHVSTSSRPTKPLLSSRVPFPRYYIPNAECHLPHSVALDAIYEIGIDSCCGPWWVRCEIQEDFKRVYNLCKINAKHETLVLKLRNLKVCMDGTSFSYDKELKLLYTQWLVDQADNCPLAAAIAEKKLSEEDFCGLREGDVGLVLQGCEYGTRGSAWTFNIFPFQVDDISEGELKLVLEEMEKFVPLKEEHKTQLSLEFLHKRSYHVLDALFVETWKGVEFEKVVQYLTPRKYNPDDPFACRIPDFISAMQAGLFFLAVEKNSACCLLILDHPCISSLSLSLSLSDICKHTCAHTQQFIHFQKAVTFPLSCDIGKFGEEVIKVVLIADHERRIQGRRFISLKHIMFGLSLSRVGEAVQKILNDRGLNKFTEKPPKMPIYFIYMLSSEAARSLGEDVVQLEHLALAIIYVKQENDTSLKNATEKWAILTRDHLESLKKANTRYGMKSVKVDVIVNNLPKECYRGTRVKFDYSVTKLIHDFGAGLSFPAIRA
ncbi:hypothetical protein RHSIM_RhsimUnG0117200 [Rhododendron simsii]|uniref:Uncharacterized protein n=1 Tax=Rhododendron simsii TaxID=118357 RepID=A0A834FVL0_RHOSS|nr:hypothetical protein RHSIM_RhsimUnG0117200 [Rhododendron simsii]